MTLRPTPTLPASLLAALALMACGENLTYPDRAPYDASAPAPLPCQPNLDGRIDAAELPTVFGTAATFRVNPPGSTRPVDLAGKVDGDGKRRWDWSGGGDDDQGAKVEATPLAGAWFANRFPGGEFSGPLDAANRTRAVYRRDDTALYLLGVASTEERPSEGQTVLVYDQPVALYRFPLQPGGSWTSVGTVRNGTFRGLPYAGRDTYQVSVDGAGRIDLPDLSFTQALRVRTRATVEPAVGAAAVSLQSTWLFECYGEVARATSRTNETEENFTTASELRRLSLERIAP